MPGNSNGLGSLATAWSLCSLAVLAIPTNPREAELHLRQTHILRAAGATWLITDWHTTGLAAKCTRGGRLAARPLRWRYVSSTHHGADGLPAFIYRRRVVPTVRGLARNPRSQRGGSRWLTTY
jgi:hypothetical protein